MWARLEDGRQVIPLIDLDALSVRFDIYLRSMKTGQLYIPRLWRIFVRSYGACVYCKKQDPPFAVDHITPIARGGPFDRRNEALACKRCNSKKTYKTAAEFGFPEYEVFPPTESLTDFENIKRERRLRPTRARCRFRG